MSFQAKRELLVQVAPRYREADHRRRSTILDEFVAATGYARKYAIRLLTGPVAAPAGPLRRPRARRYGPAVQAALTTAWTAANGICAKRLVPFLPEFVPVLERHGHLVLAADVRGQLLAVSPATADRLLRPLRERTRGVSTTRPGALLKHQVPVRTFAEWTDVRPGFMEADLVAHCGGCAEGAFLYSLVLTDVATGWTECVALLHRTQAAVVQALGRIRRLLPFPLLGLDTDNGGEFLNADLFGYCEREQITFTRGRAYHKNDQCFVEQKNGVVVRQLVGYDRFEGERAYRQLTELYRAARLYVNVFQPSMKLLAKRREGGRVHRTYDVARTPFRRLLATGVLAAPAAARLEAIATALDPVCLLRQIEALQDALWRHAVSGRRGAAAPPRRAAAAVAPHRNTVRFDVGACGLTDEAAPAAHPVGLATPEQQGGRRYRRTSKPRGPRTWRTRPDPFEGVWAEVARWLAAQPERTAKSILHDLQQRYPGQFPGGQLRTLQRRVKAWRAAAILTFDDQWLREDSLTDLGEAPLPRPLQAVVETPAALVTNEWGAEHGPAPRLVAGGLAR